MLKIALPTLMTDCIINNYMDALVRSGAQPEVGTDIQPEECDGLLLPGGIDLNPALYGQAVAPETEYNDKLDDLQLNVLRRFLDLGKPVFGICRGHQLINVALGGSLIQDLPTSENHKHIRIGEDRVHACTAEPDSFIAKIYGTGFSVNSSHHQGVDRPGDGLRVVLHAQDGVVEAAEHKTLPIWSVQFHPERMCYTHKREDTVDGSLLFSFFLEKCRKQNQ